MMKGNGSGSMYDEEKKELKKLQRKRYDLERNLQKMEQQ